MPFLQMRQQEDPAKITIQVGWAASDHSRLHASGSSPAWVITLFTDTV